MIRNPFRVSLTPEEALRAIYIDFEGRGGSHDPVLLGSLYLEGGRRPDPDRPVFRHDILDKALGPLAGQADIEGPHRYECRATTMTRAITDLVHRANAQQRHIVSWSHHEHRMVVQAALPAELLAGFEHWYRDGKATASKRTARAGWRPPSGRHSLADHEARVGYEVPPAYVDGQVPETIRSLTTSVGRFHKEWEHLTDNQRQRWSVLVNYNWHDCNGMRAVVQDDERALARARC